MSDDEQPTPPVPPSDHQHVPELDEAGSRIVERQANDTPCPQCGGTTFYIEEATGETIMATWDREMFDPEDYRLSMTYERHEHYSECDRCGWRVYV